MNNINVRGIFKYAEQCHYLKQVSDSGKVFIRMYHTYSMKRWKNIDLIENCFDNTWHLVGMKRDDVRSGVLL